MTNADKIQSIYKELELKSLIQTDKLFIPLLVFEFILGILIALFMSPIAWSGAQWQIPIHLVIAVVFGGAASVVPIYFLCTKRGDSLNKYFISVSQFVFSVIYIHVTNGRIESHFFIFGALAFIAIYRSYKAIVLITVLVALDHLIRGYYWPQSIYGVLSTTPWRSLEHAAWVLFEDVVLFYSIYLSQKEKLTIAEKQNEIESLYLQTNYENNAYKMALDKSALVSVTDEKGYIIDINELFSKISGYSKAELTGQNYRILNSGQHENIFFKELWDSITSGKSWRGEIYNRAKEGNFYWVDTTIVPIFGESGKIEKYFALHFDITEKKRTEVQLIAASKMSALGEMAGGVAHEINTPLSIIQLRADQLNDIVSSEGPVDKEEVKKITLNIDNTLKRISKIILGLKSFARDSRNDSFMDYSLKSIVNEALELCAEKIKRHQVPVEFAEDFDLIFKCNPTEITQVVLNLINNSVDALEKSEDKWIRIQIEEEETNIVLSITDSGPGIPKNIQEKMMQPFFTTKELGKGTGLGLSISTGIIEAHGGKLILDNDSQNTKFCLRFPKAS